MVKGFGPKAFVLAEGNENSFPNFDSRKMEFKLEDLNIFKLNFNWIQNKINSIKIFGEFFKSEILEFDLNIQF
jgi:hypothetical protein